MQFSKSAKINDALAKLNINNITDLVNFLPSRYLDLSPTKENNLKHKEKIVFTGKIISSPTLQRVKRLSIVSFHVLTEQENCFRIVAYNRPYLLSFLKLGGLFTIYGVYDNAKKCLNLINVFKGRISESEMIRPIYSLPKEIENYMFARLVKKHLNSGDNFSDIIPQEFIKKYQLPYKKDVLMMSHFPQKTNDILQSQRALKYEECLLFTLKTLIIRQKNKLLIKEQKRTIELMKVNDFIKTLPYKLTTDQVNAVREIVLDMNQENLMYRLLQGDVGTGKTLVAAIALLANYLRGDQGALMAPTDSLARQHFEYLKNLFKDTKMNIALLVGAVTAKDKKTIKTALKSGEIDILVGTHALFSSDVAYAHLGLAIIDEQHRFGVNQRLLLASKGEHADLLLMSATPIPRTLALTVYGDLDVTTLTQFPFKKRNVITEIIESDNPIIYQEIDEALKLHKCIYVIAPLIENNEDSEHESVEALFARFLLRYKEKVALLHGKMLAQEKDAVLQKFVKQETPILVATSVVEVGIDVKTASLMVVYDASHFGLATLHQLRGRIGRDGTLAKCFLVNDEEEEDIADKLEILKNNDDGFVLAEEDLKRRGPGELAGLKQSGLPNFQFVNIINDFKIFITSRQDAEHILNNASLSEYRKIVELAAKEAEKMNFNNV